jgi:hypothetical protein
MRNSFPVEIFIFIVALQVYTAISLLVIIRKVRSNGIDLYKIADETKSGWPAKVFGYLPFLVIYREYYKIKGANFLYISNLLGILSLILLALYMIVAR